MRKLFKILTPILVLGVGVGAMVALDATKPVPEKKEETIRPISLLVEKVVREDLTLTVKAQGEVTPRTEIDLISQVGGRIVSVSNHFVKGGSVVKGATLIKIEDADYKFAIIRAEAKVAAANLKLVLQKASAEVARKQYDQSVVKNPSALVFKEPQVLEAQANLKSAQADLSAAKLNLNRTNITLPFDGRVRTKLVDVGQYVNAGTKLARVYGTDVVKVRLPLSDKQLASLGLPIGFEATADTAKRVTLSALVGGEMRYWDGKIVRTDASVDSATRMVYAVAEVKDPYKLNTPADMPLAVGLFVSAEIEGAYVQSAFVMPRTALRGKDKVYVVASDDTLNIRTVSILYSNREKLVVSAGVSHGERVVVSPLRSPVEGMNVQALTRQADNNGATAIVAAGNK